jgi:hypothetical protein
MAVTLYREIRSAYCRKNASPLVKSASVRIRILPLGMSSEEHRRQIRPIGTQPIQRPYPVSHRPPEPSCTSWSCDSSRWLYTPAVCSSRMLLAYGRQLSAPPREHHHFFPKRFFSAALSSMASAVSAVCSRPPASSAAWSPTPPSRRTWPSICRCSRR